MGVNNNLNLTGPAANMIKVLIITIATIIGHGIYIYLKFLS
jgi:hypothetical protein